MGRESSGGSRAPFKLVGGAAPSLLLVWRTAVETYLSETVPPPDLKKVSAHEPMQRN
jgi:hypothetical protein